MGESWRMLDWIWSDDVLCDKKNVPLKVKRKFDKTVVRLITMYGSGH